MFVTDVELADGIGGQLCRKLDAFSYAKRMGYEYYHRPISDVMWHPGDCFDIDNEKEKQKFINELNKLFIYTNPDVSMEQVQEAPLRIGMVPGGEMVSTRGLLKKIPMEKKIVIHIRRGNIVTDQSVNPRYISDEAYRKLFIHLEQIIRDFRLEDHEVVILTDGPIDNPEYISTPDHDYWRTQVGMNVQGEVTKLEPFNTSILNPNLKYTIINDICSLDAIRLMLSASWLISGFSAFSSFVALGGHYKVIGNSRSTNTKGLAGSWLDKKDSVTINIGKRVYSDDNLTLATS